MRSLWAAGMLLRRFRVERGVVLLIGILVAATSFAFAAAPRLVDRAADAALQERLLAAPASTRDITARTEAAIRPGPSDALGGVRAFGDRVAAEFPASLSALVEEQLVKVTSVRLFLPEPPSYETHLALRYQDGLEARTRLVEGRWPADRGMPLRRVDFFDEPRPRRPSFVEVAFGAAQAAELGIELGDRLTVIADASDPFVRGNGVRIEPAIVEVVGLFEPLDSADEYWAGDTDLLVAAQVGSDERPIAHATAYVAAAAYRSIAVDEIPFAYEWRYRLDPGRIDAGEVSQLRADLPRLDRIALRPTRFDLDAAVIRSGLRPILDRYAAERALAESALAIAAIGPFGLAASAMATVAVLLARRRAAALALARGRGASSSLVIGTGLWEAVIIAGTASLAGLALAIVAVPSRATGASEALAVGFGAVATVLLVGGSWRAARQPLGQALREDAGGLRVPARRLVIEGTIVALAVAATALLQQRGLTIESPDGIPRADPLLASVPVLSGLAAGIVALRLYPLPVRFLGWLAAGRRDLVPVLGLRTISRRSGVANLPLLALLLAAAFGAFGSVIASSLDRGQVVASYVEVGADFRLERVGNEAMTFLDPASVPGIEAAAPAYVERAARFESHPRQRASVSVTAIDAAAYLAVAGGTPADPAWPAEFLAAPEGPGIGTPERPIPAILSTRLPTGTIALAPGDTFEIEVAGEELIFRLAEIRPAFAGSDGRLPFAIVPLDWVRAASPTGVFPVLRYWLRGPAAAAEPLSGAIAGAAGSARVVSRHEALAGLRESPLGQLVVAGYQVAIVVAAVYLALTVLGATVLSAARRTRDLAYLRTLGLSAPQSLGLSVLEHAPPVLLAVLPGIGLGIAVALLCLPALELGTFAGTTDDVPAAVDGTALAVLAGSLMLAVAVAIAAGTWLSRRARLVNALRIGED